MRPIKSRDSSEMTAPVYSGNTLLYPAVRRTTPAISATALQATRTRAQHIASGENIVAVADDLPDSRKAKRARLQVPDLPSPGRPENVNRDLGALMTSFQRNTDASVSSPLNHNQNQAIESTFVDDDEPYLQALLEMFEDNNDVAPQTVAAQEVAPSVETATPHAALPVSAPMSQEQLDVAALTAAIAQATARPRVTGENSSQSPWHQIETVIEGLRAPLQHAALDLLLQKQHDFSLQDQCNLMSLREKLYAQFDYGQSIGPMTTTPSTPFRPPSAESNSMHQTPMQPQLAQWHAAVEAPLATFRSVQPYDMFAHMQWAVADIAQMPHGAKKQEAVEAILATFEGPLRDTVMHTLPTCCDVIRHLSTMQEKNAASQRIKQIATTEPLYFQAQVMLAAEDALHGVYYGR